MDKFDRWFQVLAGAMLQRRRLRLRYHSRGKDEISERTVCPQRLVHYRDDRELLMDVMRHGHEVEVVAPDTLRQAVSEKLKSALARYGG